MLVAQENIRNMIEGLKKMQNGGGNRKVFIKRQYKRALVTRKIYHMVGSPNLRNLKMMIRQKIIQNFPVTVEDIEIEDKIFGPDVSTLEVRTTIQREKVVVDDFIEIPKEPIETKKELILCMDIMFMNQ